MEIQWPRRAVLLWRQCGAAAGQKSWQRIEVPKVCTVAILPAVAWNGRKSIQLLREIMILLGGITINCSIHTISHQCLVWRWIAEIRCQKWKISLFIEHDEKSVLTKNVNFIDVVERSTHKTKKKQNSLVSACFLVLRWGFPLWNIYVKQVLIFCSPNSSIFPQ